MKNKQVFFTSDAHFGHANVIKYDQRPYENVDEMNYKLIQNWNEVVDPEDDIYYLGDFGFGHIDKLESIMKQLNGRKFFIKGNHDKDTIVTLYKKYGTYMGGLAEITINGQRIILCHYAFRVWNQSHRGAWHLYGHSHQSLEDIETSLSFDVGMNGHNYYPLSFDDVKRIMDKKKYTPIDHHGKD